MTYNPLRPIYVVSKKELRTNLLSVRMIVLVSIFALAVVGASYGFSGFSIAPGTEEQLAVWVHPVMQESELGIVTFVSDAWGFPHVDTDVQLYRQPDQGSQVLLDTKKTDSNGFVRFLNLAEGSYAITVSLGTFSWGTGIYLSPEVLQRNLSFEYQTFDLDDSGFRDEMAMHFLDTGGDIPQGVRVYLEGDDVGSPDSKGFLSVQLNEGENNITIEYQGESYDITAFAWESPVGMDPFTFGPDGVLFFIAFIFGALLLPIVAIALSFDSIFKEKAQGSADLLLYRPASWRSVAVGKFLGVFAAAALPVTAVNLTGVLIITAVSGTSPSLAFATGFIVFSLFLLAVYILLAQTLSTVAKTAGTAILFAIVLWFVYNALWSVVIFLVTLVLGLGPGSREYFVIAAYLGLANPNGIYQSLFGFVLPEGLEFFGTPVGGFALPAWAIPVAAILWLAILVVLFLELFNRKAAA